MASTELDVPTIEISFDTPNRDRFLRDDFHNKRSSYSILGRGSYGVVIRASYRGRPIAVKILEKRLHRHRQRYDSLLNEANALRVRHDNIVTVLKIVPGDQYGLVLMERFDGHCLQYILASQRPQSIAIQHKLLILCDIINGLYFCHRHQIVHLDVKPQNVIVTLNSSAPIHTNAPAPPECLRLRQYLCKLCDFGSSMMLTSWQRSETLVNRGTIRYMAPELLRGAQPHRAITERADIYSFGVTMWQLNEERFPYEDIACNEVVAYNVVKKGLRPDSVTTATPLGKRFRSLLAKNRCLHGSLLVPASLFGESALATRLESDAVDDVLKREGIAVERSKQLKQVVRKISLGAICSVPDSGDESDGNDRLAAKRIAALFCDHFTIPVNERATIRQMIRTLYAKCWLTDPPNRPDAATVRSSLHQMLERIVNCKCVE